MRLWADEASAFDPFGRDDERRQLNDPERAGACGVVIDVDDLEREPGRAIGRDDGAHDSGHVFALRVIVGQHEREDCGHRAGFRFRTRR